MMELDATTLSATPDEISIRVVIAGLGIFVILCVGIVLNVRFLMRVRKRGFPVPPHAGHLLQRPWCWQDALWLALVMTVFIGTLALLATVLDRLDIQPSPPFSHVVVVVQNLLTQGLALGLVLHLCLRKGAGVSAGLGGPPAPIALRFRQAWVLYLAAMPLIAVSALLSNLAAALSGYPLQPQPVVGGFIDVAAPGWYKIWLMATAVIFAPVVEEVVFRGVLFPAMAKRNGIAASMVLTSMLFALIHGHLPALLPLFTVGLFLSGAYLYTGSLLVPVLMHSIFNAVNIAALLISGVTVHPV